MSQQKKNLLIIVQHLSHGGAEKCGANLSNLLNDEFNVHIIIYYSDQLCKIIYPYSGKLHCLNQLIAESRFQRVKNSLHRTLFLRKFKKQYNIDISVSYLLSADLVNIFSKRKDKTVLALSTYLSAYETTTGKNIIKTFYNKADRLVALNERGRKDAIENFNISARKINVIPNFYESANILKKYNEPTPEWPATDEYFKFIQVGRFTYAKGQWHLLRIFRKLLDKKPHTRLFIAGLGELKQYLIEYAAQLNIKVQDLCDTDDKTPDLAHYQLVLLGHVTNPFKYLRCSDAFLLTSVYEGAPNGLAEAMICGMPVFSSDCATGPREFIAPNQNDIPYYPFQTENGVLFPPFDGKKNDANTPILEEEQMWVNTLEQYIDNTQLFGNIGQNAQKRMQEFDKENVKKMWVKLLNE